MEKLSFKVPQKDKQIVLSPSGDKIGSLLEENKKIFSQYSFKILNRPFREVRENSRKGVVKEALSFSNKFDPDIAEKICPAYQYIIQSGHQPVFFHPGIWIKNIKSFSKIYNNKLDEYRKLFKVEPPLFLVASCALHLNFKSSPESSDFKISALKKKIRDLEFNPQRYIDELSLTKKEKNQIGELAEKKTELIKKIKGVLSSVEKRKISEEIKTINNFMREKVRPIKYELDKKIKKEEKKMKQSKVYTFREFPYCFFSAKTLQNLLITTLPLTPLR